MVNRVRLSVVALLVLLLIGGFGGAARALDRASPADPGFTVCVPPWPGDPGFTTPVSPWPGDPGFFASLDATTTATSEAPHCQK